MLVLSVHLPSFVPCTARAAGAGAASSLVRFQLPCEPRACKGFPSPSDGGHNLEWACSHLHACLFAFVRVFNQ